MSASTEELLRTAATDKSVIEQLVVRHLPQLHGWLRLRMGALLRAKETPEDLAQSVAREALTELGDFQWRGEAAFRHWLFTMAQRKLQDRARHFAASKRDPTLEVSAADSRSLLDCYSTLCTPSRDLQSMEALRRIESAFEALPEDYQEAIAQHRLCGLDYTQIAANMGRSEGAVRNLVYRGLTRMALQLGIFDSGGEGTREPTRP